MIHRVYSSLEKFKEFRFSKGLNIVLASQSSESSDKDTKNRSGKSSLIRIIDFVLGAKCDRSHPFFKKPALKDEIFGLDISLYGHMVSIERKGSDASKFIIKSNNEDVWEDWPFQPSFEKKRRCFIFNLESWKGILGDNYFNLESLSGSVSSYKPTFRSLMSYFVRKINAGAFNDPIMQSEKQQAWDYQVNLSYLLGLDWLISRQLKTIKRRETTIKELKKVLADREFFKDIVESASVLKPRLDIKEADYERLSKSLKEFKVLDEYSRYEVEASNLTRKINGIVSKNIAIKEYLDKLHETLKNENPPDELDIERLYQEANIELPSIVKVRVEEVREFHNSVVRNRKNYLDLEVHKQDEKLRTNKLELVKLGESRSRVWNLLETHGALEHYQKLHEELVMLRQEIESLKSKYQLAKDLEENKTKLQYERSKIELDLRADIDEQEDNLKEASLLFSRISKALYNEYGEFSIVATNNGPDFKIRIRGEESKGINNMQIFCFDLMLIELWKTKKKRPEFLIHDSHIFDGVDIRQKYLAMKLAAEYSNEHYQYIITLNEEDFPTSDKLPEISENFNIEEFVNPVRITDDEEGGIFGIRFE